MELEFKKIKYHKKCYMEFDYVILEFKALEY